jgi:hypothetical protein
MLAESNHTAASFLLGWVLMDLPDSEIESHLRAWELVNRLQSGVDHPALMRLLRRATLDERP